MCTGPSYQSIVRALEKIFTKTILTVRQKLENIVREKPSSKKDSETARDKTREQ